MKLKNLKTTTLLRSGFGIILFLMIVLIYISWTNSNRLAEQTSYIYDHPMQVRRAIGLLANEIQAIHRGMKDMVLAESDKEREIVMQEMEADKADALVQIDIISRLFLGDIKLVENVQQEFARWNAIREETIRLLKSGYIKEAANRTKPSGIGGKQAMHLLGDIEMIDVVAKSFADQFYQQAEEIDKELSRKLLIFTALAIILSVIIIYYLTQTVKQPLAEIARAANRFREGHRDVRSNYSSSNEFGLVSQSFNEMASVIEKEFYLKENTVKLSEIMLNENGLYEFGNSVLSALLQFTGAQMGAFYLLNDTKSAFENLVCIGLDAKGCPSFSASNFEGEFGIALIAGKIQHIQSIPDESRFSFNTVSGKFKPREIITIPVDTGNGINAVISIATIKNFDEDCLKLIDSITDTLGARLNNILVHKKIASLSEQLTEQNQILEIQKAEIEKAGAYNRSLIEASIDPLFTIDAEGRISDVNSAAEQVTGYSRTELIGTEFSGHFTNPQLAGKGYKKVFNEGFVRDYELSIRNKDGETTPVLYNASVFRNENGQIAGVFAAARDITERKKAEAELKMQTETLTEQNIELAAQKNELSALSRELTEQNAELEMQKNQLDEASRLKTIFLSNMSHELRTPLNSVIALSGVLNRKLAGKIPDDEYSYIEVIERNGKHLLALINDILDISRIEAGREEIEITNVDIVKQVQDVIDLLAPLANQKNIVLENQSGHEEIFVETDVAKCRHIVQNLVGNAIKFTEKGEVKVEVKKLSEKVIIEVKDTGIGIDKAHIPYIFNEFRQGDGSTSRRFGGTGLGLAIAKKYAQLLKGQITVESVSGVGSVFRLALPISNNSGNLQAAGTLNNYFSAPVHARVNLKADTQKTVLLIEDSEPAVIQMKFVLEESGYKVLVANDGFSALDMLKEIQPDGVILDLMMPGIDGFEVLVKLREYQPTAAIPVLILTAKHITKAELQFLKGNNVFQLIQKGDINLTDLLSTVSKMVGQPGKVDDTPTAITKRPIVDIPKILVVEDNPDNMITVKALLGELYEIIEATDGKQAVEMAEKHTPHLILMDIALPEIDGIEAFRLIRGIESLQYVPVIALTASALTSDRELILEQGFTAYISKPIDEKQFFQTINQVLSVYYK